MNSHPAYRFSVAPMMDLTDRHCRYFHRQLTRHALLYTEMVTTGALLYGDVERHLAFDTAEQPVALQLGGSDPAALAECAQLGESYGYREINLNCGCPSYRVQNGAFGACLMKSPDLVTEAVQQMKSAVKIPVTVKCRIGVDDQDEEADLHRFAAAVIDAGCDSLIVHARKAWLQGLSPRQNREVPPLDYPRVYRLKEAFADTPMILNGGINTLEEAEQHLQHMDGVMLGRSAYYESSLLMEVDQRIFGDFQSAPNLDDVIDGMADYIDRQVALGARASNVTRHMLGLFQAIPGARQYRRTLSEKAVRPEATSAVLREAYACVAGKPDINRTAETLAAPA